MKDYHSFNFLRDIYYVRTAGSQEEIKTANLIKSEVEKLGGEAHIEEFEVDYSEIKKAKLVIDNEYEIECAGSGYSGSTKEEGVTGQLVYVNSSKYLDMFDFTNKIVLITTKRAPHKLYMKALKEKALGIICTTGDVYKDNKDVDLDPYLNRELDYKEGLIPCVMIRMKDAEKLLSTDNHTVSLTLISKDSKRMSRNVIAEIKGSEKEDEVITFSAHMDSVSFSKGAYDNGTGVISLLQFFNYYMENKPKRTLKFIWCGAEEMGLLGSKNYCSAHEEYVKEKVVLNINIDMVAVTLGRDIACVTGNNDIVNYMRFVSKELGFPIDAYQGVYSSDSTPFADKGVPAISFARIAERGGAVIHSHDDVIERLSEPNYLRTIDFIINFVNHFINAKCFPIKKEIPQNMVDEIDYYYSRKERP